MSAIIFFFIIQVTVSRGNSCKSQLHMPGPVAHCCHCSVRADVWMLLGACCGYEVGIGFTAT